MQNLLGDDVRGWPVIIQASNATDKSRTAKLLEKRDDALVAMFYPPDLRSVTGTVRTMADAAGVNLTGELAERLARACGLDTRLAQSEVMKLALYLDAAPERPRKLDAQTMDLLCISMDDDGFAPLVNVVLGGRINSLADELRRCRETEMNAVGLLLAFERRTAQLAQLAARCGDDDIYAFMEGEKASRRVFFKDAPDLTAQLKLWRGPRLARLSQKLTELHRQLMHNSHGADILLGQTLAEICQAAHKSAR